MHLRHYAKMQKLLTNAPNFIKQLIAIKKADEKSAFFMAINLLSPSSSSFASFTGGQ